MLGDGFDSRKHLPQLFHGLIKINGNRTLLNRHIIHERRNDGQYSLTRKQADDFLKETRLVCNKGIDVLTRDQVILSQ